MRHAIIGLAAVFAGLLAQPLYAEAAAYRLDAGHTVVSFDVKATLHGFTGYARKLDGSARWDQGTGAVSAGAGVIAEVGGFSTGDHERDEHMREMFEEKRFPEIRFGLERIAADPAVKNGYLLEGTLTMHGIARKISIPVTSEAADGGRRVRGAVKIKLADFDLHPPSLLKMIRVAPEVTVRFDSRWLTD